MSENGDVAMVKLAVINPHITCPLCKGYFIDATTVTECLHTFCKSCIVKHLDDDNTNCPSCNDVIHQSHPMNYIIFDRTMQDIVFKLVPDLEKNELKREKEFYASKNLPNPKDASLPSENTTQQEGKPEAEDYHRMDSQVNIFLESANVEKLEPLKRPYLRISAHATVTHLKKYVAKLVLKDQQRYGEIDISCIGEVLGKDHMLEFISLTRWRNHEPPMHLKYQPSVGY